MSHLITQEDVIKLLELSVFVQTPSFQLVSLLKGCQRIVTRAEQSLDLQQPLLSHTSNPLSSLQTWSGAIPLPKAACGAELS